MHPAGLPVRKIGMLKPEMTGSGFSPATGRKHPVWSLKKLFRFMGEQTLG
jgi:hypothetical protein